MWGPLIPVDPRYNPAIALAHEPPASPAAHLPTAAHLPGTALPGRAAAAGPARAGLPRRCGSQPPGQHGGSVGAHVCLFRAHACLACMQHNIAPEHLDLRSQTIAQQAARTCKYWYTRAAYSPNASSLIPSASSAPSVRGSAASGSKGQSSCAGHGAARQRGRVGGGHSLAVAERSPSGRPAEARNQQGKLPSRAASAPCICPPAGQPRPAARGWAP